MLQPDRCELQSPSRAKKLSDASNLAGTKSAAFGGGFLEYQEHSGWNQYEPFVELELRPTEDLTITPGFKYVSWDHYVSAPLEQKRVPVGPANAQFTTTRDLPFLMANYKIEPSWSVYAQYAQGIYVPDISSFEQKTVANELPKGAGPPPTISSARSSMPTSSPSTPTSITSG